MDRGCGSSSEGGSRAAGPCSSAVTPGGRRRVVAEVPRDYTAKNILGSKVPSVIGMTLSLDRRFPRAQNEKVVSVNCTCHMFQ
jgi:hypothetical protein